MTIRQWKMIHTIVKHNLLDDCHLVTTEVSLTPHSPGTRGRVRWPEGDTLWEHHLTSLGGSHTQPRDPGPGVQWVKWYFSSISTHHTVCVVATGPSAGVNAVMVPADVPIWTVQVMVTVTRAEIPDLVPTYIVTLPATSKSGTIFPSKVSRISCWGKCLFLLSLSVINITAENIGTEQVSQTVFASTEAAGRRYY